MYSQNRILSLIVAGPLVYNDGSFLACSVTFPFNASNLEKGL